MTVCGNQAGEGTSFVSDCVREDNMVLPKFSYDTFSENFIIIISLQKKSKGPERPTLIKQLLFVSRSGGSTFELFCCQGMRSGILVVVDHNQVRCLLKKWFEAVLPDLGTVEAKRDEEAVVVAQAKLTKLVVINIALPEMDVIRATMLIKEPVLITKVVILIIHEKEQYKKKVFSSGVNAYTPKRLIQIDSIPALSRLKLA